MPLLPGGRIISLMVRKSTITLPPLEVLERGRKKHRPCAVEGCPMPGEFRAPISPEKLYEYQWFCLEHARAFNEKWNYFAGKSPGEIEAYLRGDAIGHRPTRNYSLPSGMESIWRRRILREFAFGEGEEAFSGMPRLPKDVREALAVFGYTGFPGKDKLRSRYRALVKEHHPDRHGGSRDAEEKIKKINLSWQVLKDFSG